MSFHFDPLPRQLLVELLRHEGREKGARLASRFRRAYELRSGRRFDLARFSCTKFSEFLEAHGDILQIIYPSGPGDIEVELKDVEHDVGLRQPSPHRPRYAPAAERPPRRLPPPIWQAFANPDPSRARYFNRRTGEVAHYREDSNEAGDSRGRDRVAAWGAAAVRVPPISAETQHGWMRGYLDSLSVPDNRRSALEAILKANYTSDLNTVFVSALGPHATGWRAHRARHVLGFVAEWAEENNIPFDSLLQGRKGFESDFARDEALNITSQTVSPETRLVLHRMIDLLRDDELSSVLIPLEIVGKLLSRAEPTS